MGLVTVDELLLFSCIERHAKRPALPAQRTNLPLHGHTYAEGRINQRRLARNHPSPSLDAGTSSPVATARIALRISKSSYPSVLRVSCKSCSGSGSIGSDLRSLLSTRERSERSLSRSALQ